MIERCRALAPTSGALGSRYDWDDACGTHTFDLIFASLVLQHVDTTTCHAYLRTSRG